MSGITILLDVGPPGGAIGAVAGIVFFLILVAVAFVVFRLLKKTLGMALRVVVVLIILAIAFFGTMAFFYIGGGGRGPVRPRPPTPTPAVNRVK